MYRSKYIKVAIFRQEEIKAKIESPKTEAFLELQPATLLKKGLWHRCFSVNFGKLLRTPLFTEHLRWLLLHLWATASVFRTFLPRKGMASCKTT